MAKDDFKNAAAKLLSQHARKNKKSAEPLPSSVRSQAPVAAIQPVRSPVTSVYLSEPEAEDYARYEPMAQSRLKIYILAGLALLGCAIMVFLVPETIFGMVGNAVVGVVFGVGLGLLINREI